MTRIPFPNLDDLEPRVRDLVGRIAQLNLVKIMAHAQGGVESVVRLSDSVLNRADLDPVLRQVALLRLCVVLDSPYERAQIESVSKGEGMSDTLIEAACFGSESMALSEPHRMACRIAEELAVSCKPSEEVYRFFADYLSVREFVELVQAIGFYCMQARMIETFEIAMEDPPIDLSRRMEGTDLDALEKWRNGAA